MKLPIKDDANKNQALTVIPDDIINLISGGARGEKNGGSGGGGGGSGKGRDSCSHDRESKCNDTRCHDRSSSVCRR